MKHLPPALCRFASAHRQRGGAVLGITMVLLLILLLVGVAIARGTFVQAKMSSNFYDREIAFQAAQAALRQGEAAVQNAGASGAGTFRDCSTATTTCLPNPFADANMPTAQIREVPNSDFPGANPSASAAAAARLLNGQPQYIVEYLGRFPTGAPGDFASYYRITARSNAIGNDRASVTLQSIFRN